MFCPNCGTQVTGNFCPNCGTPLNAQPAASVRSAPNPGYAQPNPGYAQPNPGYAQPNPGYAQPNPGYSQSIPVYAQPVSSSVNNAQAFNQNAQTVNVNFSQTPTQTSVPVRMAPVGNLRTNRTLLKTILLSILTLGIYSLVMMCHISGEINEIASRYDNKRTMHYALLLFIVAPITLGIAALVWEHRICNRMGAELTRRGIPYTFSAGTFWGWGVLGCLIIVGPFVFLHKFLKSMNLLCADYNVNG